MWVLLMLLFHFQIHQKLAVLLWWQQLLWPLFQIHRKQVELLLLRLQRPEVLLMLLQWRLHQILQRQEVLLMVLRRILLQIPLMLELLLMLLQHRIPQRSELLLLLLLWMQLQILQNLPRLEL